MRKVGALFGGAFLVTLVVAPAIAGDRIPVGQCRSDYVVYHGGPIKGQPDIGANGLKMREGYIMVTDLNALPFGTYVSLPDLYPGKVFQVQDYGNKDPTGKGVLVWHDNLGLAINFSNPPPTKLCVVKPTPDQLASSKLN